MPNPSGQNSNVNFNGFTQDPPKYGDKQRQGDLARTAPVAGSAQSQSAINAPRRGQRQVVRGQNPTAGQPVALPAQPSSPPVTGQVSYPAMVAAAWAAVAAEPGASPLVQQYAAQAQQAVA